MLHDSYSIDTYYVVIHLVILLTVFWLYLIGILRKEKKNDPALLISCATLGAAGIVLGIAIYTNLIHMYYIAVLAYGVLLLVFIDKTLDKQSKGNLTGVAIVTGLMLLCGNFTLQWIILGWLLTYAMISLYMRKQSLQAILPILIAIACGFVLGAVQLIPTLDLMLSTERASVGGGERFAMSPGPFQWFSYIAPGAVYFAYEHADMIYGFMTGNNVVDGTHYVGIIPFAAFLCIFKEGRSNTRIAILLIAILFVAQRSLGVYSPINIILNQLPIFGQFRASVRYLFVIDIII
jgi:hypothetical protein